MGDPDTKIKMKEPITFGSVVNPGLLWACYPLGYSEEASMQKCKIDADLKEHFCLRKNRRSTFPDELQYHTKVAIQDPYGTWMRGVIVERKLAGKQQTYDVFLVDVGDIIHNLVADDIYILPEKLTEIPTQAFLIALYGIEPLSVDVDLAVGATVLVPSENWSEYQMHFMKKIVTEAEVALFHTKEVVNNVRHGTLFVEINHDRLNINEMFVESKLALERDSVLDVSKYLVKNCHYDLVKQILGSSPVKQTASLREGTPSR